MKLTSCCLLAVAAICLATLRPAAGAAGQQSAAEAIADMYDSCLSSYSTSCVRPKALAWISRSINDAEIKITDDLSIIRTADEDVDVQSSARNGGDARIELFDKLDSFMTTHSIRIRAPAILRTEEARSFVGDENLNEVVELPLNEDNQVEG